LHRPDLTLAVRVGDDKGPYRLPLKDWVTLAPISTVASLGASRTWACASARLVEETKTLRVLTPF